jgi:F5/8 type C domain/Phage tail repeat like
MVSINEIWGLLHELDQRAKLRHQHTIRDIDGLSEALQLPVQQSSEVVISSVVGLSQALDDKAGTSHTHPAATEEGSGFMSAADKIKLNSLSNSGGASTIAQVTGLQTALDSKPSTDAVAALVVSLHTEIDSKAAAEHGHGAATSSAAGFMSAADKAKLDSLSNSGGASTIAQVTGLTDALAGKAASDHTHPGLPNLTPQQLTYTASQSSPYGSTPAGTYATLTDGNFTTGTGTNSDATAWIKADLGAVKAVSQVWIGGGNIPGGWGTAAGYLNGASLEVSIDDANWAIAVVSLAQITDAAVTKFAFGGLLARYVRIRKSSSYIGAGEFRIFG